jgi:hypothetical protein
MKKQIFLVMLGLIVVLTGCSKASSQTQETIYQIDLNESAFPHSMKGWELYSWSNGSEWYYSILVGTNRLKSCEEVMTSEAIVTGTDSLKTALNKFPEGEFIIWLGPNSLDAGWDDNCGNLSLPPEETVGEIKQYCVENDLTFITP